MFLEWVRDFYSDWIIDCTLIEIHSPNQRSIPVERKRKTNKICF